MLPRATAGVAHSVFSVHGVRTIHISNWHASDIIVDRKSRFQARHTNLTDPAQISEILAEFLRTHKNIAKAASHPHIYAWRTGDSEVESHPNRKLATSCGKIRYVNIQQGFCDNGERGAGSRLLEHLVLQNVVNKLVIVTRWYGGSPLGSLRFRHISTCSFDSLRRTREND